MLLLSDCYIHVEGDWRGIRSRNSQFQRQMPSEMSRWREDIGCNSSYLVFLWEHIPQGTQGRRQVLYRCLFLSRLVSYFGVLVLRVLELWGGLLSSTFITYFVTYYCVQGDQNFDPHGAGITSSYQKLSNDLSNHVWINCKYPKNFSKEHLHFSPFLAFKPLKLVKTAICRIWILTGNTI